VSVVGDSIPGQVKSKTGLRSQIKA